MKSLFMGVLLTLSMVGTASASYIFDLRGTGGDLADPYTITSTGVLTALVSSSGGDNLYQSTFGLGVSGNGSVMIDEGESLMFDFAPESVTVLSSLIVEPIWSTGNAMINVYGDGVFLDMLTVTATTSSFVDVDLSSYGWEATTFSFQGAEGTDRFSLKKFEVTIPEPAPIALLGLGLLSLGLVRRAKKS